MSQFLSSYLSLTDEFKTLDVFDSFVDADSHYFVNISKLKAAKTPEFQGSYQRIIDRFTELAEIIVAIGDRREGSFYRTAKGRFSFPEKQNVRLGFSDGTRGTGLSGKTAELVLNDAIDIVKKGVDNPRLFLLCELFSDGVGPDHLSDMVISMIYEDILAYTKRILNELHVSAKTRPNLVFSDNGLVIDSFDRKELLFVPTEIVDELPIAVSWSDIDRVVAENAKIKKIISDEIGIAWARWSRSARKGFFKTQVMMNTDLASEIFSDFDKAETREFTYFKNLNYLSELIIRDVHAASLPALVTDNSYSAALIICGVMKEWAENQRGWDTIGQLVSISSRKGEKILQSLIKLIGNNYGDLHDFDVSFEPDQGVGPSDVKISYGTDKTIIEVKLSSNPSYLNGLTTQLERYAEAERAKRKVFLYFDLGNPERLKKLQETANALGEDVVHLIVVDCKPQTSASKLY